MKKMWIAGVIFGFVQSSHAVVLDWQGMYRIEGVQIDNNDFTTNRKDSSYILHHLYLKPKIEASDGLKIYSRLDLFNSGFYPNSQMGQFFGHGPNPTGAASNNERDSNVLSQTQKDDSVNVTELYLTLKSETGYGMLIAGRKMFHFGLGITHNNGSGSFDHYFDSKDMLAYKMSVGNFTFTPIFAKINEQKLHVGDDINDYIMDLSYYNKDTEIKFGILYESRVTGGWGNDAPTNPASGSVWGGNGTNSKIDHWNGQRLSLYYERKFSEGRIGIEIGNNSGDTGISTGTEMITLTGYGFALEGDYKPGNSRWSYSAKAGIASGDDPKTPGKYEGFIFDRNYNVGFLLMNHVMGSYDVFRTALGRSSTSSNGADSNASAFADEESISNVMYFAPEINYHWKPNLDVSLTFVTGTLNVQPDALKNVDTSIGYELDLSLNYKPSEKMTWINGLGVVFPGGAFSDAGTYPTEYAIGLTSKAAISF
ncbi:MAG: hypothetical protein A4S09_05850 [Proteobacteria bacterium SG_bin7]|nr:MAG: hypothetical protein A4S09_05850 [Proteobacteria bacterium SG_bin7]